MSKSIIIAVIILIVVLLLFPGFMMSNSTIVCGKYKETFIGAKGAKYVRYVFIIDGKKVEGSDEFNTFSKKQLEDVKKGKCMNIQVSKYWSFFNRRVGW